MAEDHIIYTGRWLRDPASQNEMKVARLHPGTLSNTYDLQAENAGCSKCADILIAHVRVGSATISDRGISSNDLDDPPNVDGFNTINTMTPPASQNTVPSPGTHFQPKFTKDHSPNTLEDVIFETSMPASDLGETMKAAHEAETNSIRGSSSASEGELSQNHRPQKLPISNSKRSSHDLGPIPISSMRPSLHLDLTDSELENHIQDLWIRDKAKKAAKKAERASLRAQGVLEATRSRKGRLCKPKSQSTSKDNRWQNCLFQINSFMDSAHQECALPPVDAAVRKKIHEVSRRYGLSSQSRGHGHQRHTVIRKGYKQQDILQKHYDHRGSGATFATKKNRPYKDSKQRNMGYQEGEIVGAKAPCLSKDNIGCVMLEKMGWDKGAGLGADRNKGPPQPIVQVVKKTRAGLG